MGASRSAHVRQVATATGEIGSDTSQLCLQGCWSDGDHTSIRLLNVREPGFRQRQSRHRIKSKQEGTRLVETCGFLDAEQPRTRRKRCTRWPRLRCSVSDNGFAVRNNQHICNVQQARDIWPLTGGKQHTDKGPRRDHTSSRVMWNRPELNSQRLSLGVFLVRLTFSANNVFRADANRSALRHIHRDDAIGFLTAGQIAQQGGLDVVRQRSVLGFGNGLQPARAIGVQAQRDGDLASWFDGASGAADPTARNGG